MHQLQVLLLTFHGLAKCTKNSGFIESSPSSLLPPVVIDIVGYDLLIINDEHRNVFLAHLDSFQRFMITYPT